jgi:hypothetical protein
MTYTTPEPKKILVTDAEGQSRRFYPYPKECKTPLGVHEVNRFASGFGFIVKNGQAIYGNSQGGIFSPARAQ